VNYVMYMEFSFFLLLD